MLKLIPASVLLGVALFPAVASADATWSAPKVIAPADDQTTWDSSRQPLAGVDGAGNVTAVWVGDQTAPGGQGAIVAATRTPAGSWSGLTTIGSNPQPQGLTLAVGGSGHVVAGWADRYMSTQNRLALASRAPGGAWTQSTQVEPPLDGFSESFVTGFSLDVADSGQTVGLWNRSLRRPDPREAPVLESKLFTRTGSGAAQVSDAPAGAAGNGTLAADAAGNATVVFRDDEGVKAAYRPAGGSWTSVPLLDEDGEAIPSYVSASVSVNAAGDAVIALSLAHGVAAATRSAGGSFGPVRAVAAYTPEYSLVKGLVSGIDDAGRATLAWTDVTVVGSKRYASVVRAATAPKGAAFGTPADLSAPLVSDVEKPIPFENLSAYTAPTLAVGKAGETAVAWSGADASQVAVRSASGGWEPAQTVAGELIESPGAVVDPAGVATVLWQDEGAVAARSTALRGGTVPNEPNTTRRVVVKTKLVPFGARSCPTVVAMANGRSARIKSVPTGEGRSFRCAVDGQVTLPASTRLGSSTLLVVYGPGLLPAISIAKVTN